MISTIELQLIRIMLDALREATEVYREALKNATLPELLAGLEIAKRYDSLTEATQIIYKILIEDAELIQAIEVERERCRNYRKHSHG